ncbi:TetR/AcrR family transcriptional regulator [Deinococcus radiodurans]|uniref:TetR/AcrR family transcriptional regulator n=1 Tax=Deinococcus radiodurans TaxID=1299 RepID=UPI00140F8AFC|nr:TetR/AcrR family transcriptional regulator [Deinococcus radiodurans]QIP30362.1 TetR/AcrR family transcriptional regulator [Deinococcus radiodurans]QIP33279.1 TetR/AcrR family transcriptional regulator [Deinococcus radiodurans]UTA52143.1 TetR/AcrR family transcriptional regulator [Deinococcus radiodurans]
MARPPAGAPLLSAEKITRQALDMLHRDGLDGLSIRKLAAELGVSPKSLYHYFPTKEDLLQGVYSEILRELELPDLNEGSWQERFSRLAHSLRRSMVRHASFIGYYFRGHRVSREELDVYESLYRLLRQVGLPEEVITKYGSVLVIFMVGFCYAELNGNFAPSAFAQRRAFAERQPERFPLALSLPMPAASENEDDFFEVALELMLAGIKTQIQEQEKQASLD